MAELPTDWSSYCCAQCHHPLGNHTMWFVQLPEDKGIAIDRSRPVKCPLGQASVWIGWDDALAEAPDE